MIHRSSFFSFWFIMLCLVAAPALAQQPNFDAVEIKTSNLGGGIYMLEGVGGNIGVSVGTDGVFLIDDQFAPLTPKILAAIAKVSSKPIDYVINTHWHADHVGGNENLGKTGIVIVAHDNVRARLTAEGPRQASSDALPVITFSETMTFHYNGHEIYVVHPAPAHTDGDAMIYFRDIDVIHAGDILFNGLYPFIDADSGGSVDGYIAAMEQLAATAGPNTKIIAGHGPLATKADVEKSIAMLKEAKARIAKLVAKGKTLDDIKATDPLADYNAAWAWEFITGPRMIDILYNALKR